MDSADLLHSDGASGNISNKDVVSSADEIFPDNSTPVPEPQGTVDFTGTGNKIIPNKDIKAQQSSDERAMIIPESELKTPKNVFINLFNKATPKQPPTVILPTNKKSSSSIFSKVKSTESPTKTANIIKSESKSTDNNYDDTILGQTSRGMDTTANGIINTLESVGDELNRVRKSTYKAIKDITDPSKVLKKGNDLLESAFTAAQRYVEIYGKSIENLTGDQIRRATSNILDSLDLSRTVLAGCKYTDPSAVAGKYSYNNRVSRVTSAISKVNDRFNTSINTQLPIPYIPTKSLSGKLRSDYSYMPAFGSYSEFRQMGVDSDFWWGIDLTNSNPENSNMLGSYIYHDNGIPEPPFSFGSINPGSSIGYIPCISYSVNWRKESQNQINIGDKLTLSIPSMLNYPSSITTTVLESDIKQWDVYLREYCNQYYDISELNGKTYGTSRHRYIPRAYKTMCSTLGVNIFYFSGKRYLRTEFYVIPTFDFSYEGSSEKSPKEVQIVWNIYGENVDSYSLFNDIG